MSQDNGHLSIGDILALDDLPVHEVPVPQWNTSVRLRSLRADERSELEAVVSKGTGPKEIKEFRRRLLLLCMVGADGSPMLDGESSKALMQKSSAAIEVIIDRALEINGITAKDREQLEKNS